MDKYWKQKEKERIRNKELEKGHGLHWQHKHFRPKDILFSNSKSREKEVKKPELKIKENRFVILTAIHCKKSLPTLDSKTQFIVIYLLSYSDLFT